MRSIERLGVAVGRRVLGLHSAFCDIIVPCGVQRQEELDFPNEWYFAADEGEHGTLYLMPSSGADAKANFSDPTTAGREVTLVATMHERVVQSSALPPPPSVRWLSRT